MENLKTKFKNKTQAIMFHLNNIGRLSQKKCTELYGATRLSGIIFDKRRLGYDIISHKVEKPDRFNKMCNFVEYELVATPEDYQKIAEQVVFDDRDGIPTIRDFKELTKKQKEVQKGGFFNKLKDWFTHDGEK